MLEIEGIEKLLSIIPKDFPSIEIMHISDKITNISKDINELCQASQYGYDIEVTSQKLCSELKEIYNIDARVFDFDKHRYNRHAKLYDFVFITLNLDDIKDLDNFLKKLYPIIKNSGKVLFILDYNYNIYSLEEILTDKNYVAINEIEALFKKSRVLSAQKMHGWGNK